MMINKAKEYGGWLKLSSQQLFILISVNLDILAFNFRQDYWVIYIFDIKDIKC